MNATLNQNPLFYLLLQLITLFWFPVLKKVQNITSLGFKIGICGNFFADYILVMSSIHCNKYYFPCKENEYVLCYSDEVEW